MLAFTRKKNNAVCNSDKYQFRKCFSLSHSLSFSRIRSLFLNFLSHISNLYREVTLQEIVYFWKLFLVVHIELAIMFHTFSHNEIHVLSILFTIIVARFLFLVRSFSVRKRIFEFHILFFTEKEDEHQSHDRFRNF